MRRWLPLAGADAGRFMLAGWKNMHPGQQYFGKFLDLYEHIEDKSYIERTERFERWYENPIDLPGRYYLQAILLLFKENRFAKGEFIGLGRKLSLMTSKFPSICWRAKPTIYPEEQVFEAERLSDTPKDKIEKRLVPGGHIGLFMGSRSLTQFWPKTPRGSSPTAPKGRAF